MTTKVERFDYLTIEDVMALLESLEIHMAKCQRKDHSNSQMALMEAFNLLASDVSEWASDEPSN